MKIKTAVCSVLMAALWAGCASEKADRQEKQAKWAAEAKVSQADAQTTALAQVQGGTIKESEIEKEHGRLVWSFDISIPGSTDIKEVAVDAMDGKVVSVETESAEKEAKEKD